MNTTSQTIPVVSLRDFHQGGAARASFVKTLGNALADTGFFAVEDHGVPPELTQAAYRVSKAFFAQPQAIKSGFTRRTARGQRGYTGFGTEHAKNSQAPDLKEFWQVGRTNVSDDHAVHAPFGANYWPDELVPDFRAVMTDLYQALDGLGQLLLESCALHLDEPQRLFRDMAEESDTIVRVLYYPAITGGVPAGAVRSAAHEDINLITLLSGATSEGLELLTRDGTWLPIHTGLDTIVVDAGDMLQNLTNGFYKSTTHRVVNPHDTASERFSMPCFVHPRKEVDLTPMASCVARTGGQVKYPSLTAGEYLDQRLREIGLI